LSVVDVLRDAGAEEYEPNFARHRITFELLTSLTDQDLYKVTFSQTLIGVRGVLMVLPH